VDPDHFGPARIVLVIETYIYRLRLLLCHAYVDIIGNIGIAEKNLNVLFCSVD
jgi:hypothetical protein